MLTRPVHTCALQLIRAICRGAATPQTALPHILRLCDEALGPEQRAGTQFVTHQVSTGTPVSVWQSAYPKGEDLDAAIDTAREASKTRGSTPAGRKEA
ncbi:hypothetical protein [Pseudorhodoferax sp.]|uniref:hypothetical protein n=1 Tax=Pseudorhodoferax sp. TaxID=1993553 RepID=UPI0039E66BF5